MITFDTPPFAAAIVRRRRRVDHGRRAGAVDRDVAAQIDRSRDRVVARREIDGAAAGTCHGGYGADDVAARRQVDDRRRRLGRVRTDRYAVLDHLLGVSAERDQEAEGETGDDTHDETEGTRTHSELHAMNDRPRNSCRPRAVRKMLHSAADAKR